MPIVAAILYVVVLLWMGLYPAQLHFHAAWESITAQKPPAMDKPIVLKLYIIFLLFSKSVEVDFSFSIQNTILNI